MSLGLGQSTCLSISRICFVNWSNPNTAFKESLLESLLSDNLFHDHLDICTQCRENPFGLCAEGDRTLRAHVADSAKTATRDSNPMLSLDDSFADVFGSAMH